MITKRLHLKILIPILLAFNCYEGYAQDQRIYPSKKNHFYFELGGIAGIYSFNYERLVTDNFSIRGGIGITPGFFFIKETILGIPLTASYLAGNGPHKFEAGLGTTFFALQDPAVFNLPEGDKSAFVLTGILGYRYFKPRGGFTFRICFTPFYNPDEGKFLPWGGISFGYEF